MPGRRTHLMCVHRRFFHGMRIAHRGVLIRSCHTELTATPFAASMGHGTHSCAYRRGGPIGALPNVMGRLAYGRVVRHSVMMDPPEKSAAQHKHVGRHVRRRRCDRIRVALVGCRERSLVQRGAACQARWLAMATCPSEALVVRATA